MTVSNTRKRCLPQQLRSCEVSSDGHSITFSPCGLTSHHPMDVRLRFCALCTHYFPAQDTEHHDDLRQSHLRDR